MTGFDDAFDAQMARSRESAQAASATQGARVARIERMRAAAEHQLNAAGHKAVAKLRSERVAPVELVADQGRFRRNVTVGVGWPLGRFSFDDDYGRTRHRFGWFLLDDGRLAPNGSFQINSRYGGPNGRFDQRDTFEQAYRFMLEELDIVEVSAQGYRFGGLVHADGKYAVSIVAPHGTDLAFDEINGQLLFQTKTFQFSNPSERRMFPVEVALAELVAQAVLEPVPDDWL